MCEKKRKEKVVIAIVRTAELKMRVFDKLEQILKVKVYEVYNK